MGFLGRLSSRLLTGFRLTGQSLGVLRRNPRLAVFPAVSTLATACYFAAVFGSAATLRVDSDAGLVAVLATLYFGTALVAVFCNAALMWAAREAFAGRNVGVGAAFRAAAGHLPALVAWALLSALVGLLLRAVEETSDLAGDLVAALLGTAWAALTYFVVPTVVFEDTGPRSMVQRSGAVVRETWGEALGAEFSTDAVAFLLVLPGILVGAAGLLLLPQPLNWQVALVVGLPLAALGGLFAAALNSVTKTALWRFAAGEGHVEGFDRDALGDAAGETDR